MKSLLEQLYKGTLPIEQKAIANNPEYRNISNQVSIAMEQWKKQHSSAEYEALEQLLDLRAQIHNIELTSSFTCGFRLGAGIITEVLTGQEELAAKLSAFPEE